MSFKSVVVLGGGPIGLLSAIEARRSLKSGTRIFVVEKRSTYTRGNVPLVDKSFRDHLNDLGVGQDIWDTGEHASFSKIEEKLSAFALQHGIEFLTDYVVESVNGVELNKKGARYKRIEIVVKPVGADASGFAVETLYKRGDKIGKKPKPSKTVNLLDLSLDDMSGGSIPKRQKIDCDLLIVATGTGAATDPIVSQLGFTFTRMHAANYATFGLFDKNVVDGTIRPGLAPDRTAISFQVPIKAQDHNYLLVILNGISRADFRHLRSSSTELKRLVTQVGRHQKDFQSVIDSTKSAGIFKVKIQRAEHCASTLYPAVLVGDAAVAPHPQAGSGILSGFKGLLALKAMMAQLKSRHRSQDNDAIFDHFDEEYSAETARKAVEGTFYILTNLIKLITQITARLNGLPPSSKPAYAQTILDLGTVDTAMKKHLKDLYDECGLHVDNQKLTIPAATAATKLQVVWGDAAVTYRRLKTLTQDILSIDTIIDRMEQVA